MAYMNGQIVFDLVTQKPIKVTSDGTWAYALNTTHFIKATGHPSDEYDIAFPKTVEEAVTLLYKNLISVAPSRPDHCWKCGNWNSNHRDGKQGDDCDKPLAR